MAIEQPPHEEGCTCPWCQYSTITATAAGGKWSSSETWQGGKIPEKTDDVVLLIQDDRLPKDVLCIGYKDKDQTLIVHNRANNG